jgi:gliding motility-associated-like protein
MKYLLLLGKVLIPLLIFTVRGCAQANSFFFAGESVQFEITPFPAICYSWKVIENTDFIKGAETDKVTYLTTKNSPVIRIRWEKAGKYFLALTGINENGCSNMKIYLMIVSNDHAPVAANDFVTADWLKSIRINALANDFDVKNDLDTASLKILTKAEYGEVTISKAGVIVYAPFKSHSGRDQFYYRICDRCNQCDSAMVTIDLREPPIYLPEGISPNGDGLNDRFVIKGLEAFEKSSLTIFGRDGVVIYKNDDYRNDWTGLQNTKNHNAIPVPNGTYYYLLCLGGTKRIIKGFVYLIK